MGQPPGFFVYSLLQWLISGSALLVTAYLVRGFHVKSFGWALVSSIVVGFANIFIWPALMLLSLPLNIVTLGLFTFVVNGAVLKLVAAVIPGFDIEGWLAAIFGAIVLSLTTGVLRFLVF